MMLVKPSACGSAVTRRVTGIRPIKYRRSTNAAPRVRIIRAATDSQDPTTDASAKIVEKALEVSEIVKAKWEKTEDKPAAIIVASTALVGLYAVIAVVDAVDKIPVFSSVFEVVGLIVSGWLGYRLITAESDRKELWSTVDRFVEKVTGKKN